MNGSAQSTPCGGVTPGEMRYLLLVGAAALCYIFGSQLFHFLQSQPYR